MGWEFDWLYALQPILHPMLDKSMVFLSTIGNAGIMWIVLAIICLIMKKTRRCGAQMAVAMLVTFVIGNLILKNAIGRDRPCWIDPTVVLLVRNPTDFSFPSGHSMNGFTAAVTILFYNRRWGIAAVVLAALIAFSRLYHFVHFPTDVFAGIVIGTMVACVTNVLFVWINKRKLNQHEKKNCRIR